MLKVRIGPDSDARARAEKHIKNVLRHTRAQQLPGVETNIAWARTRCDYCPTMIWSKDGNPLDLCESCAKAQEQEGLAGITVSFDTLPEAAPVKESVEEPLVDETTLIVPSKSVLH